MLAHDSDHIKVEGHLGTWYVIDEGWAKIEPEWCNKIPYYAHVFLLEHETYGDEAAHIIVDDHAALILEDVWNGFDDLEEAGWEIIGEQEYKRNKPASAEGLPPPSP